MAVMLTSQKLVNLANTVRLKVTENSPYLLAQIPDKIRLLKSGSKKTPGTYDKNDNTIKTWPELKQDGDVVVNPDTKQLTTPDDRADRFSNPDVVSVVIDPEVKEIGDDAFKGVPSIEEVIIPSNVDDISPTAFEDTGDMRVIDYTGPAVGFPWGARIPGFYDENGNLILSWIDAHDEKYMRSTDVNSGYIYPEYVYSHPVYQKSCAVEPLDRTFKIVYPKDITEVSGVHYLFRNLTQLDLPSSLRDINNSTYNNCEMLSQVRFPTNLKMIGDSAFSGCYKLVQIHIPASVTEIRGNPFAHCDLASLTVADSNTIYIKNNEHNVIIERATNNLAMSINKDSTIPTKTTNTINERAFMGCSGLISINIPDNITTINKGAFLECEDLKTVTGMKNVTTMGAQIFKGCKSLESVEMPTKITRIPENAFSECKKLNSITVPATIEYIDNYAFTYCESLNSIEIPSSVKKIGAYTFRGCTNLATIKYSGSATGAPWGAPNATVQR